MQLFSQNTLKQQISNQNKELVQARWQNFQKFVEKIESIKGLDEQTYQDGFIRDIFENCLGYKLNINFPNDYNIVREQKNASNSQKADGAILVDDKVVGVIELKSTKTKDLEKRYGREETTVNQAFNYLTAHDRKYCHYVIVSNFDEFRFYIDDKLNYQKYSLFNLSFDEFSELHYLLCYENISKNIPLKLKEQQSTHQENISNEIYKKYSNLRVQLFDNLIKNNENIDKNILLASTQKILDRMIFIFFAEDRGIIPSDTISKIIEQFKNDYRHESLYSHYKIYFEAINVGNDRLNIHAYNGGLFAKDEILDNLIIDDSVLQEIPSQLTKYDFNSEIDVNILGHIFENSLNDIEELKASINDENFDKTKTKRKKDGVFYTPEYITRYIVENTLGKLCDAKKEELGLNDIIIETPNNYKKLNKNELAQKNSLEEYRKYLIDLKIVDPACGSGAFLNQALNYLLNEHNFIDENLKTLTGDMLGLYDIKKEVLEHNLYGVDINEEAVEIAKLSLWLRTVENGRPLTKLAQKLKVGNSLIDDKNVVPNAFEWEKEFPEVFAQGGFDVVIGNPPYVPAESISSIIKEYLPTKYISADGRMNLYIIFYELGLKLLIKNGLLGFITPYTLLKNQYYGKLRKYILENFEITEIVDFSNIKIFEDATVDSIMLFIKNSLNYREITYINKIKDFVLKNYELSIINQKDFLQNDDFSFQLFNKLLEKLLSSNLKLKDVVNFNQGIITGDNKGLLKYENQANNVKIIKGADFNRYYMSFGNTYLDYSNPKIHRPRKKEIFEVEKLLLRQTGSYPIVTIDTDHYYTLDTVHNGILIDDKFNLKYIMSILNSNLIKYIYGLMINEEGKTFAQVKIIYIDELPIKEISFEEQEPFIEKADLMLELNKKLQNTKQNFIKELKLEKVSTKLQNFESLEFEDFIKEYTKVKKLKLTKLEERKLKEDWQELFEYDKKTVLELQSQINQTDKEIDNMVYELYGLSDDEIKIVEGV